MQAGLLDTYHAPVRSRGLTAWALSALLFATYLLLYFTEVFTPPAVALGLGSKWTLYGLVYTLAMVIGGAYFLRRHGNSRYHRVRTIVVVLVQVVLAFALPLVMTVLGKPEYYFSYFWPLKIEYLYPHVILQYPFLIVLWSALGSLVVFPIAGYFFGKRFYCSWICGCGGLANTAGEPWRHLSDKSVGAWRFEKVSLYSILVLAIVTTHPRRPQLGDRPPLPAFLRLRLPAPAVVRPGGGRGLRGRARRRPLPAHGHARVVPLRLPDGGDPRPRPEVRPLPDHGQEGHVHLVRQLLDLLRDGDRRPPVRHGQPVLRARVLRGLRHVRPHVPAGRPEARDQAHPWKAGQPIRVHTVDL